jgi:hypothetical protein
MTKPRRNYSKLYFVAGMMALSGGFHFGYQISTTNASANLMIQYFEDGIRERYEIVLTEFQMTVGELTLFALRNKY